MVVGGKFEFLLAFKLLEANCGEFVSEDRISARPLPCLKSLARYRLTLKISSYLSSSPASTFSPNPNLSTLLKTPSHWKPSVSILEEVGITEDLLR
jgi:hypothetical protein